MNKTVFFWIVIAAVLSFLAYGFLFGTTSKDGNTDDLAQVVLRGSIDLTDNKVESLALWDRDEKSKDEEFDEPENGSKINVDILNCAGYIASAKATYNAKLTYWKLEIISETVASDAVEKVKLCVTYPESKYISSNAFAIVPTDEKRKQMRAKKLEKPSIYSLPFSVQMWAEKDGIGNWADTDGDGKVDLVTVSGACGTSEEYICSRTLSWNGLRWVEIAYTKPA